MSIIGETNYLLTVGEKASKELQQRTRPLIYNESNINCSVNPFTRTQKFTHTHTEKNGSNMKHLNQLMLKS